MFIRSKERRCMFETGYREYFQRNNLKEGNSINHFKTLENHSFSRILQFSAIMLDVDLFFPIFHIFSST